MTIRSLELADLLTFSIQHLVKTAGTITAYREPLVGFAAAEPATYNFDHETLVSRSAHKSVAVIAGLGSFGLHHLVITDAGCAGRFGSLVLDAELPISPVETRERCLYFHDGTCLDCVVRCPVAALDPNEPFDKQVCWQRCQEVALQFQSLSQADVCGKCAIGPCSFAPAL